MPALGGKTPLEAANTPHMDSLIREGSAGLMDIIGPGITVGTDTGHLALFDQDVKNNYYRRGPMEAAGVGIFLNPGEVALRCNFATVDSDFCVLDRRAGRIRDEAKALAYSLDGLDIAEGVNVVFRSATEHRAVLLLTGEELSEDISDSDPGDGFVEQKVLEVTPQSDHSHARRTADLVNRFIQRSHPILQEHPVNKQRRERGKPPGNIVLTRGAGIKREYSQIGEKRGLRVACVSGECTVLGLARLSGMTTIVTDGMTGNLDTNLRVKASMVLDALRGHDLVYLHLKGCDVAGHDKQPQLKRWFIEQTDEMIGQILEEVSVWGKPYFVFAGDHSTLCELGEHSGDPVPVFMTGPGVSADDVKTYGEGPCAMGRLGRLLCREFLMAVFDCIQERSRR